MGLRHLEHFLILTHDPAGTRDWWCRMLGLREGDHPDFGFPIAPCRGWRQRVRAS